MVKWTKPQNGRIKLNFDATVQNDTGKMGFGFILRDDNGNFIAAKSVPWKGMLKANEAEAMTVREA